VFTNIQILNCKANKLTSYIIIYCIIEMKYKNNKYLYYLILPTT